MLRVGIYGASGYSGMELLSLLARHSEVEIAFATSDRFAGRAVADLVPIRSAARFIPFDQATPGDADVVLTATPAEVSVELGAKLIGRVPIIDLSNAFRPKGGALPAPARDASVCYGLLPCFADERKTAAVIANPGCYATAISLALAPLAAARLIEPDIIADAVSGTTGAGRRASEEYSFSEVADDVRAYSLFVHPHALEIRETLARLSGEAYRVTFTPKLIPIRRGILATSYARLRDRSLAEKARQALIEYYADEPFVQLADRVDQVRIQRTVGTNLTLIHLAIDETSGQLIVVSALDNLIKGAAGQAVENLNLAFGLDRTHGLEHLRRN